jgi:hypothetical protein
MNFLNVFRSLSIRGYRKHSWIHADQDLGRSVKVLGNPNRAYAQLRDIINESRVRETVRLQSRFEPNPIKRRRKRKENDWNIYMSGMKRNVLKALELKTRTELEQKNYQQL